MSRHESRYVYNYPLPLPGEVMYGSVSDQGYAQITTAHSYRQKISRSARTGDSSYECISPQQLMQQPDQSYQHSYGMSTRYQSTMSNTNAPVKSATQIRSTRSRHDEQDEKTQRGISVEIVAKPGGSQRFYCDFDDCTDQYGRRSSVGRKADLKRHVKSVHGTPTIDCKKRNCERKGDNGFCREDHYREHLRGYHNEELPKQERRRDS